MSKQLPTTSFAVRAGDFILGRCVTIGDAHRGFVEEVRHCHGEYEPRFLVSCEDGRERVMFFDSASIQHAEAAHSVINAATGALVLVGATLAEFDRWYDHHADWRKPRGEEEVNPRIRDAYREANSRTHFLVQD